MANSFLFCSKLCICPSRCQFYMHQTLGLSFVLPDNQKQCSHVYAISEGKGKNLILYVLFLIETGLHVNVDLKTLFLPQDQEVNGY